jgi:Zn-dependent peptidase ImmA (M78 family)
LSRFEAGLSKPTPEQLKRIADALEYPEHFFFFSDPIYGPSTSEFFHRKRKAVPVKALDKIHAQLNVRRIHISRLTRATEISVSVPRIDPDEFNGDVEEIARAVRAMWQLPRGPVKNVVSTIEDAGGVVIRMPFETSGVDAVSWWTPGDPPMFVVNERMPADRERLTLCHELAHLVMHTVATPDMEDEANRFAAAFLMPAEDIKSNLSEVSLRSLAALKQHWQVSMQALLKQAMRLGTVDASRAKYLWAQLSSAGYRTREPAELDFPKEEATLLRELVETHTGELGYDLKQLSDVLGWFPRETSANYSIKEDPNVARKRMRAL